MQKDSGWDNWTMVQRRDALAEAGERKKKSPANADGASSMWFDD
jgi:hypothetical protein